MHTHTYARTHNAPYMHTIIEGSEDDEEMGFEGEQDPMDDETAEDEFNFSHGPQPLSGDNEDIGLDLPQGEGPGFSTDQQGGKGGSRRVQRKHIGLIRE